MQGPNVPPTALPAPSAVKDNVTVDKDALQAILDYLTEQPYKDVYKLIGDLSQSIQRHAMMRQMQQVTAAKAEQDNGTVDEPPPPAEKKTARGRRLSKS